jgi:hypothetical protein
MSRQGSDVDLRIGSEGSDSVARWGVYSGARCIHGTLPDADTARWVRDLYYLDTPARDARWDEVGGKRRLTPRDCTDNREGTCVGVVEYRGDLQPGIGRLAWCQRHSDHHRSLTRQAS